jgi:hypothetical protein
VPTPLVLQRQKQCACSALTAAARKNTRLLRLFKRSNVQHRAKASKPLQ